MLRARAPAPHREFEGASWLTKRKHLLPRRKRQQCLKVTLNGHRRVDHVQGAVPAVRERAGASISGARRFVSSASRKSRASTTRTFVCLRNSWRRAARSCRGG